MNEQQLIAGVARNNARALDPRRWKLRWLHQQVIPTGTVTPVYFGFPAAAAVYRLEYALIFWPVTGGVFRPLFLEIADDRGTKFTLVDPRRAELANGVNVALFTTPNTDPNATLAGDQSAYLGTTCLDLEFPGRAVLTVLIRGATAAPNPASIEVLLTGHQRNEA